VVDDCTRECLTLVADTSISGMRVARELDRLLGERGKPTTIVSDNGSELSSKAILCDGPTITRWPCTISRRGRAERLAESFIGHLRDELLNETLFRSLAHTRAVLEAWRAD
jgi:putative transposase